MSSNKLLLRKLGVLIVFFCFWRVSFTQTDTAGLKGLISLVQHIEAFNRIAPQEKVYLHFDNTGYFVGETIRFKAYTVDAFSFRPTPISKVLYVELLNDAGITRETKKLKIEDGQCHGEFLLKNNYQSGFYQVRAYTRYMLNFGNEKQYIPMNEYGSSTKNYDQTIINDANFCVFSRVFPVYDAPDSLGNYTTKRMSKAPRHTALSYPSIEKKKGAAPIELNFFPEGGNLITGLESVVAFEARESSTLKPFPFRGNVVDREGNIVAKLQTLDNGRGVFNFRPEEGKKYTASFYYEGKTYHLPLPQSIPSGYVMRMDNDNDRVIKAFITKSDRLPSEILGISVMCRGKPILFDTLTVGDHPHWLNIPMAKLSPGVNQITLFNMAGEIYSERLFFVYPPEDKNRLRVSGNTSGLNPYQPVNLRFEWMDASDNPVESSFSLSISDYATREETYYTGNILTDLLLSSDLKGFIENASSYFADTTATTRQRLDLLMLVQGWRRYRWKEMAGVEKFEQKYCPEAALTVDGRLINWYKGGKEFDLNTHKRITDVGLKINLSTDSLRFEYTYAVGKNGRFSFELEDDIYGKHRMSLIITDKKKRIVTKGIPVLDRVFSPDIEPYSYYETHYPFEHNLSINTNDSVWDNAMPNYELDDVTVQGKRSRRRVLLYEFPDIEMDAQEYFDLGIDLMGYPAWERLGLLDLFASTLILRYRISGSAQIFVEKKGRRYRPVWCGPGGPSNTATPFTTTTAPYAKQIQTIRIYTNRLAREQYASTFSMKASIPDVIIGYILYPDKGVRPFSTGNGIRFTTFQGYDRPEEFYNPDYSSGVLPDSADVRRTLYWNPNVKTDRNGKASVSFYNNNTCKHIHISAEGITKSGVPVFYESEE